MSDEDRSKVIINTAIGWFVGAVVLGGVLYSSIGVFQLRTEIDQLKPLKETMVEILGDKAFTGTPEDRQKAIRSLQNLISAEQRWELYLKDGAVYADEYLDEESALDTLMGNVPPSPDDD